MKRKNKQNLTIYPYLLLLSEDEQITDDVITKDHTGSNITLATVRWFNLHSAKCFANSVQCSLTYWNCKYTGHRQCIHR